MKDKQWLILTEYFYPDTASGTGRIMTELAEELVKRGFSISVVCGQPSYRSREHAPFREYWRGITVTRLSELDINRYSGLGRLACWTWFMFQCLVRVPFWRRKYHRILVVTNPAPALSIGWLFKHGRAADYVALVHDVFPENAIAVGKSRGNSLAVRAMKSLNRVSLHAADMVVTIGEDMKTLLCADYGLSPDKVCVIPNWASKPETSSVANVNDIDYWQRSLGLGDHFLVLYAGNFGFAQDADLIIQCLAACSHMTDVLFCFAGGGGQYDRLRSEETSGTIPNLKVVSFQSGTRYASLLKLAGCGLVSLHPHLRGMAVPSKITTYMAAGLPTICLAEQVSDLANMVEGTGSGIVCQSAQQFADAVCLIVSDNELRSRLAGAALKAADTKYSRSQCVSSFVEVLSGLMQ